MGAGEAETNLAFTEAMRTEFPQTADFILATRELLEKVKSGEPETGFITGRIAKYIDPDTAELNAASIEQAVKILQSAKLQPVSDKEFETIKSSVVNILAGKEVNTALLERTIAKAERELQMRLRQMEYFRNNGNSLFGWETEEVKLIMEQMNQRSRDASSAGETVTDESVTTTPPPSQRTGRNPRGVIQTDDLPPLPGG